MAKLLVHENSGVREFELLDAEIHIGRELDNTLRLPDPSISRHHCVIRKTAAGYEIQDLQSSNGVLLNGSRVQSSPLRDGDRVTLGQIQLTFSAPPEPGATVAINVSQVPPAVNPLGTVRMSPEEMAAIHGGAPAPESQTTGQTPIALDIPAPAPAPTPAPAPVAPPVPAPAAVPAPVPVSQAPAPVAPTKADPGTAPGFGHFTGHAGAPGTNPAPAFIQGYLPPIPDNAIPTGERGDFGTRLLAILIDAVPLIAVYIVAIILAFIPFMGCIVFPVIGLAGLAYNFLFIPWCESTFGATFGKKIMKLRVVPEDNPHARIDFGTAILRRVGHILNFTFGYLLVLGSERKHVGDMISKSICIKVDR